MSFLKIDNLTDSSIYLGDIGRRTAAYGPTPKIGQEQYVPANGTIYVAVTGEVLLSKEQGAIKKLVAAGKLAITAQATLTAPAALSNYAPTDWEL
jgi:hypothetical protein